MYAVLLWLGTYAGPAVVTCGIVQFFYRKKINPTHDALIIHAGLAVSILASQYALHARGWSFPWQPHLFSVVILAVSIVIAIRMLGVFGLWYGLSAFLQQLTLLSVSFLLLHTLPLFFVLLLVVPLFTLAHGQNVRQWHMRLLLISAWGALSIGLFTLLPDIYLLAALHTILGTFGIRRSIVYPSIS